MYDRKLILYIAMSLDGFIATKDDGLDFLSIVDKEGEDYGYFEMSATVDTYLVGRKTYDVVMDMVGEFQQAETYDCYVLTRQNIPNTENVTFYNGDIEELLASLRSKPGKNIYCDGGGQIVKLLMDRDLIDEYIISVIPTILGDGKRLFVGETLPRSIELVSTKQYEKGLVQLRYIRTRD